MVGQGCVRGKRKMGFLRHWGLAQQKYPDSVFMIFLLPGSPLQDNGACGGCARARRAQHILTASAIARWAEAFPMVSIATVNEYISSR